MGDPNFCWSDVERELKSWAATNAEAIDTVLTENEWKFVAAMKAETDRRAALQSKTHQEFTVVAKSTNLGGVRSPAVCPCRRRRQCVDSPSNLLVSVGGGAGRQRAVDPR